MNKTKKNCIFALLGLFVLMMTAASVNADEEPNLIAPRDILGNKDASSGDNNFTTGLILVIGIAGIASLAAALIIFKKKN